MIAETESPASVAFADQQITGLAAADAIRDDVTVAVLSELMGIWLARQPSIYMACRRVHAALTPLSDAWIRALVTCNGGVPDAAPIAQHVAAFVATFADLADEGRKRADCGIHDHGLMTMPDWIDWQCFIAETYARGKARDHGMPAHIGTLAAAVICGALRDEATERYVAAHDGNTTRQ